MDHDARTHPARGFICSGAINVEENMKIRATATAIFVGAMMSSAAMAQTVGVSWSNFQEERWKTDEAAIKKALEAAGATYISADAQSSSSKQLSDVESLIAQGAEALIILSVDKDAIGPAIDQAAAEADDRGQGARPEAVAELTGERGVDARLQRDEGADQQHERDRGGPQDGVLHLRRRGAGRASVGARGRRRPHRSSRRGSSTRRRRPRRSSRRGSAAGSTATPSAGTRRCRRYGPTAR